MTSQPQSGDRIRFGVFEADLHSREFFKDGHRIALPNQSFVALAALLERPGRLVSREELRQRLWPDHRIVEFDQGLNAIINRLREALDSASPGAASLIETLPRRGYRFIGTLHRDKRAPRSRRLSYTIVIALCASILLAGGFLSRHREGTDSTPRVEPLTALKGREISPLFTSNGDDLLFAWNGAADAHGTFDLYRKALNAEPLTRLTHERAPALHVAASPDGSQIALAHENDPDSGIDLIAPAGGTPHRLVRARFLDEAFMQMGWSPEGQHIAYAAIDSDGLSHLRTVDPSGHDEPLSARPADCIDAGLPAYSPDARSLAFVCRSSVALYKVFVLELGTGTLRALASVQGQPQGLAWAPDKKGRSDTLIIANDAGNDSGLLQLTLEGHLSRMLRTEGALGPGLAVARGQVAFVRAEEEMEIRRADLSNPTRSTDSVVTSTRTELVPDYSPDGTHIAFESTRSGSSEIWQAQADGRNPTRLTDFRGPLTGAPSWCSDGRRIAFDSRASGASAIYILDVLDSRPHRLQSSVANLALPVWSPDCRWIIASNGRTALYRLPSQGGLAERFTDRSAYRAVMAGTRVIFNVAATDGVELWSKPVDGGAETALEGMPRLDYSDSWTATPHGIYATSSRNGAPTVSFYDFASHRLRAVRALDVTPAALGGLGIAISPDHQSLLYTRKARAEADILMITDKQ